MAERNEVLVVYSGFFHPPWRGVRRVVRLLRGELGEVTTRRIGKYLPRFSWDSYRLIVLYLHRQRVEPEAVEALAAYLEGGGALLALHSATASFKENRQYQALIGGAFAGHGPVEQFECFPADDWTRKIVGQSFSVVDELYNHIPSADRTVHLTAQTGEPIAWSRRQGAGQVFYLVFGHRAQVFNHPAVQGLVTAAARRLWDAAADSSGQAGPTGE